MNRKSTTLSYNLRNDDGDDIININISWENGDLNSLQANLNTWLRSMNVPLKVVASTIGVELADPKFPSSGAGVNYESGGAGKDPL